MSIIFQSDQLININKMALIKLRFLHWEFNYVWLGDCEGSLNCFATPQHSRNGKCSLSIRAASFYSPVLPNDAGYLFFRSRVWLVRQSLLPQKLLTMTLLALEQVISLFVFNTQIFLSYNFQTSGHWESFVIFCSPDILLLWAITTQKPIIILASKYSWSHCYQPDIQFIISASILILILRNSTRYQKTLRISFPNFWKNHLGPD